MSFSVITSEQTWIVLVIYILVQLFVVVLWLKIVITEMTPCREARGLGCKEKTMGKTRRKCTCTVCIDE
jgi:hypothetical protein